MSARMRQRDCAPALKQESGFWQIAANGFGDAQNSYAFSMAWFDGGLYVGTNRDMFQLIKASPPKHPAVMTPWPVDMPASIFDLDLRAQIWRYHADRGEWDQVYASPIVSVRKDEPVARDIGYRCMTVLEEPGSQGPALYIATASSNSRGPGAHILRYTPKEGMRVVSAPGLGDPNVSTFRAVLGFRNRLYTSPAGSGRAWNAADRPCVYESADPASGKWRIVSDPHFGDPTNEAVYCLCSFANHLYAGTLNSTTGFQVWRTEAVGEPPYRWQKVLSNGAYRGSLNQGVVSMCAFKGSLYIGSGISNGGYDRTRLIGPAAAEVIRINHDDTWDLIVGRARETPDGYKRPLSSMSPGFDTPFAGYIWSLAEHEGRLYAGTFDSAVFALWANPQAQSPENREKLRSMDVGAFVDRKGGCDLWFSDDGTGWHPVTQTGFHNPYNYGIRTMQSTPLGLFVGTANPFGPKVATKTGNGWEYVDNPRGGLEVWLGAAPKEAAPSENAGSAFRNRETFSASAQDTPWRSGKAKLIRNYDRKMYEPLIQQLYHGSDFYNFGFWYPGTKSLHEAAQNLVEELLKLIPSRQGKILDVACGMGATTRHISRYYAPETITGINISEKQLETCRRNAPQCEFLQMDATRLEFPDESFDAVICVEAAFHFKTREQFLREAYRVLRRGGHLALSDMLLTRWAEHYSPAFHIENHIDTPEEYRALLEGIGFQRILVRNVTAQTWTPYVRYTARFLRQKLRTREIGPRTFQRIMTVLFKKRVPGVRGYVLVGATK